MVYHLIRTKDTVVAGDVILLHCTCFLIPSLLSLFLGNILSLLLSIYLGLHIECSVNELMYQLYTIAVLLYP